MKHLLYLFPLFLVLVLLGACGADAEEPVPAWLEPQLTAFHPEYLPEDYDYGVLPRYDIKLRIDPENYKIEGTALIRFRNQSSRPLNDFYVRLYPNLPQLAGEMKLTRAITLPERFAAGMGYVQEDTAARIMLIDPVPAGEDLLIELSYEIDTAARDGYVLFGENEGVLSLPYSYPMLAAQTEDAANPWRLEIPPPHGDIAIADPALYTITATVPSEVTLVTTGVETNAINRANGWTDHVIVTGPVREVGMLASDRLEVDSLEIDGTLINSYYLPEDTISGRAALQQAASVFRTYSKLFAPYPFTELDVVETPTRYLGMEFPGLNYIGMDTYRGQSESQEWLVAHEIAHQWWYGLVGSDPFRYPWLDEGLAEHSSLLYWESLYGVDDADRIRTLRWEIPTKWAIDNDYDDAVGQEVTAFEGANYEVLVYAKSARFFDALYKVLGREKYLEVLRAFIDRYGYTTARPSEFLQIVREVGGIDPGELYEEWIWKSTKTVQVTPTP